LPYAVIPSIRVRDVPGALRFYTEVLGFELVRGGPGELNNSLKLGDANIMIEGVGGFYSEEYNRAIERRMGGLSPNALYIEGADLEGLAARAVSAGAKVVDPLQPREWGQSELTIEDPEGNWLTFWQASQG